MTLIINKLSVNSGDNPVLENVSLTIESGEILGIFGARKSDLLRTVAGEAVISGGAIFFDGVDVTGFNRGERGFIKYSAADDFYPNGFDAAENFLNQSSGEKQISEFENLLKSDARIFLLDNPLCFADAAAREEKLSELKKIAKDKNASILMATGDFNEIFSICDRAAIFDGAAVVQTAAPREIYENPKSAFVAAATGRINLIDVTRLNSDKSDSLEFQTASGKHRIFIDRLTAETFAQSNKNPTLGIRPEHISISFGASFPEDNLVRARISGVKYLGSTTLIELDAVGLQLQALVLRLVGLKIGDECIVGLPPNRILVLEN